MRYKSVIDTSNELCLHILREVKKMITQELRIVFVRIEALHPPLPRFEGTQLHELFVDICKRHSFETFELLGDRGMTIETEDEREFRLERERLIVSEYVRRSFNLVRDDFVDMFERMSKKFDIPIHVGLEIQIRALWPSSGERGAYQLIRKLLSIKDDQLSFLGSHDMDLVGVRLCLTESGKEYEIEHDLQIQPWPLDQSQLQINSIAHFDQPVESPSVFGQLVDESYQFLLTKVDKFIHALS